MKQVTLYETADGKRYPTAAGALAHARQRYETQQLYRAMDNGTVTTPTSVCAFLDDDRRIEALEDLFARKRDMQDETPIEPDWDD